MCVTGEISNRHGEGGGEAPLISGLAGLRGSLPCVKGDGHFGGKFWHIVTKSVT